MNADDRLLLTFAAPLIAWLLFTALALAYSRRGTVEVRLNPISVLGAMIGYLALTQGWSVEAEGAAEVMGPVLFMFGSITAVFTPIGGALQLIALASVVAPSSEAEFGAGLGLAILSTVLVLSSLLLPSLHRRDGKATKSRGRFLTISLRRTVS
ncbi:MAG: hypothetical protein JW880_03195 [Candidatus Thermoplasmatota archaeon]|nr:hypothetical protein [Candidatus Thermoplasmatota archaeon]